MSADGQGIKQRRNIAENFSRLSRAHERYRRQTDGGQHAANANVINRLINVKYRLKLQSRSYLIESCVGHSGGPEVIMSVFFLKCESSRDMRKDCASPQENV